MHNPHEHGGVTPPPHPDKPAPPAGARRDLILLGDDETVQMRTELTREELPAGYRVLEAFSFPPGAPQHVETVTDIKSVQDAMLTGRAMGADVWLPWPGEDIEDKNKLLQLHLAAAVAGVGLRCGVPLDSDASASASMRALGDQVAAIAGTILAAAATSTLVAGAASHLRAIGGGGPTRHPATGRPSAEEVRLAAQRMHAAGLGVIDIAQVLRQLRATPPAGGWTPTAVAELVRPRPGHGR